jgi:hypothetical protein
MVDAVREALTGLERYVNRQVPRTGPSAQTQAEQITVERLAEVGTVGAATAVSGRG